MNRVFLFVALALLSFCGKPTTYYDMYQLEENTLSELQQAFKEGRLTSEQVVIAYLKRIESVDDNGPTLNAVLTVNPNALEIAHKLDAERKEGKIRGPLHGIPVLLKDNIDTDNMPTTAGSVIMKDARSTKDAFIVTKLKEADAIILGKVNLSEWANFHSSFSSSGWSALGGQTQNPYDITRN